jgi:dipeptidyl-peptidase-4
VEDLLHILSKRFTTNGSAGKMINGTFDGYTKKSSIAGMVLMESGQSSIKLLADQHSSTRDYYMLNTTDSVYSRVIRVEYPLVRCLHHIK